MGKKVIDFEDIQQFVNKYNRFKSLNSTENFLLFYSTLLKNLTEDTSLCNDALLVIHCFVERIRIADNLIDKAGYPLNTAFPIVFPEIQNHISRVDVTIKKDHVKTIGKSQELMNRANVVIKQRFGNDYAYNKLICEHLINVYHYGENEALAKTHGIASREILDNLLEEYNCDFYLYNAIVFDQFLQNSKSNNIKLLRELLKHYLVIDGILDSLCDLFDDLKENSFNFLLSMIDERHCGNIRHKLLKNGIYKLFYDIAETKYNKACSILLKIDDEILHNHLDVFLEGAWQGLSISEQSLFFVDSNPTNITNFEKLLYKPHPWEIIDGKQIMTEQHQLESKICSQINMLLPEIAIKANLKAEQDEKYAAESYYKKIRDDKFDKDIIILRTGGCSRAFLEGMKCHHCGINKSYYTNATSQSEILDSFRQGFLNLRFDSVSRLAIYCNGSFFDDAEISESTREQIYNYIAKHTPDARLFLESHPQYITTSRIFHMRKFLLKQDISIGLGFDAKSNFVRNVILNKNISVKKFESAVNLLKNFNVETIGWVSVKAPFLTEVEGIKQAIITGRYIQNIGVNIVSLEPTAIQYNTIQALLAERGEFRVPWLWSCIEVAKELIRWGQVLIGGDVFLPVPIETAKNCPKCTERIKSKIKTFNEKQDISILDNEMCDCKKEWREWLASENYAMAPIIKVPSAKINRRVEHV